MKTHFRKLIVGLSLVAMYYADNFAVSAHTDGKTVTFNIASESINPTIPSQPSIYWDRSAVPNRPFLTTELSALKQTLDEGAIAHEEESFGKFSHGSPCFHRSLLFRAWRGLCFVKTTEDRHCQGGQSEHIKITEDKHTPFVLCGYGALALRTFLRRNAILSPEIHRGPVA